MSLLFRPRCPSTWPAATPATAQLERLAQQLASDLSGRSAAFSDVEFAAHTDVVGESGFTEWVVIARHTGPFVVDDETVIAPTGDCLTVRGVTVAEFAGGSICSFRHYWDELGFLDGLGLLPHREPPIS